MLTTKFVKRYTCDRCGAHEDYTYDYHYMKPDGWFKLSGKHPNRTRAMRDKHFCSDCFVELFGYDGLAWKIDEEDDDCDGEYADDGIIEEADSDEDEEVHRFYWPGCKEPYLTVTIHADGTSTVERNDADKPITVGEAVRAIEETGEWKTEKIDMSGFKNIGEISDVRINGGYFGILDDDDDGVIGLTD